VALERPPARRDLPAQEREVTSLSDSYGVYVHHVDEVRTPRTMKSPPSWRVKCQSGFMTLSPAPLLEQPVVVRLFERA
jgi:hypothetical protein